ncbi:MAG: hypothetical protein WBA57_17415 [Elainellaceae cyanobacterium]
MPPEDFESPLFEIMTPLGIRIRTTPSYWKKIITLKHPIMVGQEEAVQQTLQDPSEIRRSQSDADVYLYYKPEPPNFICVVTRHLNGEGFVITTYRTNRIKIGDLVWTA